MINSMMTNDQESPFLTWTKELEIGHKQIDADHQDIFDIANRLRDELREDPEYSIVGQVLVELIDHTGAHFMREEALMKAMDFPGYEDHKLEHELLMHKVNSLHRRFMRGHSNLSFEVAEFVTKSMVPHIMSSDIELSRCMRNKE